MRIWLRRHRIVTRLVLAALALAGNGRCPVPLLPQFVADSPSPVSLFARLRPTGEPSANQARVPGKLPCCCRDAGICQTSVSRSALSRTRLSAGGVAD